MGSGPLLVGIDGLELDSQSRDMLHHPMVGGVILFARNFEAPGQVAALVKQLRDLRRPRLLIAVDQEGGRVQRFRKGFTKLPPLASLGALWAESPTRARDMAYRHARVMATEVLAYGVDLSFAPVLDLGLDSTVIGDRAFHAKPDVIVDLASHYLAGMRDAGMKSTGKHFPGHGTVVADSHHDVVVDPRPLDEIEATDLVPFRRLSGQLDAVMAAHVIYPAVDDRPAGFSRRWIGDFLRTRLEYGGVIISDDLCMQGAETAGGLGERLAQALDAGCDLALICEPAAAASALNELSADSREPLEAVARLYGTAMCTPDELAGLRRQGAGEFAQWQASLEELQVV